MEVMEAMASNYKITKGDLTSLAIRSSFLQASFNYERMQSCGFTWSMCPLAEKVFGGDKAKMSRFLKDNLEFINTHPNLVGFLMGRMMSLEENDADPSTTKGLKLALFGPIAGIGDAIFWFTILPIVPSSFLSICLFLNIIMLLYAYPACFPLRIAFGKP